MSKLVFDIESNGFLDTMDTIWCIAIKEDDKPTECYGLRVLSNCVGTIEQGLERLKGNYLIGHNIISFDLPAIKKVYGLDLWETCEVFDTLIASKLKYPNLPLIDSNNKKMPPKLRGRHGLKAWGYRVKNNKGTFGEQEEAWDALTESMVDYCIQDVDLNYDVYKRLQGVPEAALSLEQDFARVIQRQIAHGWYFDLKKAQALHVELIEELETARDSLFNVFKPLPTWVPRNVPKEFKLNGENTVAWLNAMALGCVYNDDMEFGYYKDVEFNPNSGHHIVRWVEHLFGKQPWTRNAPTDACPEGTPKTGADEILRLFKDMPWAEPLTHYFEVNKLLAMLAEGDNAWLKLVKDDSRIHGGVDTLGAVTRRCTHSKPNVAQCPSNRAYKGHESRELFTVPRGKKLVGCDADGLELRTLSHYLANYDEGAYADAVDKGDKDNGTDIHTLNQKGAGLPTRDAAKTFIYAFLYGAGDGKIGEIVDGTAKEGKALKAKFFKQIPAIKQLVEAVKGAVERKGTLNAIDGNKHYIRSPHSALNVLLQGCGALVMKYYLVALDNNLQKEFKVGIDYEFVGNIHDEVQIEVDEDKAERVAEICKNSFDDVTEILDFRIPIRGSADIGDSWADTH